MNSPQVQMGVLDLIWQSGPVAKFVLMLLFFASVLSWAIIITKARTLRKALAENARFLNTFWHSKSIEDVFNKSDKYQYSPVASVFQSGFKELKKVSTSDMKGYEEHAV